MKSLVALFAVCLLGVGVTACGGTTKTGSVSQASSDAATVETEIKEAPGSSIPPAPVETKTDEDKDNDVGASQDDKNNDGVLDYAHAASDSDKRAITALIKRYYAVAVTGNGAKACPLLYSIFAESLPEDYGQAPPGPSYLNGAKTCTAVMKLLFRHFHPQLASEVSKLKVSRVRLDEHHGLAVLNFGKLPERQILVVREGHVWKIESLIDSELP